MTLYTFANDNDAGKPLYGWHDDRQPGDTQGDGQANGTWKVARP